MTTPNPPSTSAAVERSLTMAFYILAAAAAAMAVLRSLLPVAGHDQLWFLLMARRWLGGATLYGPEIFDPNPPFTIWLSAIPVTLSPLLHLSATAIAKALVTLLEAAAALLTFRLLRRARPLRGAYEMPALLCAAILLFFALPARDFGQRDQVASVLLLPYLLAAAIKPKKQPKKQPKEQTGEQALTLARCAAGVLAAAGICLKPHYALIPLSIEAALLLVPQRSAPHLSAATRWRRLFRPEPILIVLLGAVFLAAIRLFSPLYLTSVLPLTQATYWAVGHYTIAALAQKNKRLILLSAITLLLRLRSRPSTALVPLLQLAGFVSAAIFLLQGTGWYYQQLPALVLLGAAIALQLLDFLRRSLPHAAKIGAWLPAAAVAASALIVGSSIGFRRPAIPTGGSFAIYHPAPAYFEGLAPGTPVAILSTTVEYTMMPVERYGLFWAQRTNMLFMLPAALRLDDPNGHVPSGHRLTPEAMAALDALQRRWMVEDLQRWHPQLVLVQRCQDPQVVCSLEVRQDLVAWFARDPAFAAVWSRYTPAGSRDDFDAYTLSR